MASPCIDLRYPGRSIHLDLPLLKQTEVLLWWEMLDPGLGVLWEKFPVLAVSLSKVP